MVIVTGSVVVRPDKIERAVELSLAHVRRSREEPGCLLHSVHRDVEDPNRLVFVEHWSDLGALRTHFAVPTSGETVRQLAHCSDERPSIEIYEATPAMV